MKLYFSFVFYLLSLFSFAQELDIQKQKSYVDCYNETITSPNLISICSGNINANINSKSQTAEASRPDEFKFPSLHLNVHDKTFSDEIEDENLKNHFLSVGFSFIHDYYSIKSYAKKALKKVFSEKNLTALPRSHLLFSYYM